jgi:O-methyltransferase
VFLEGLFKDTLSTDRINKLAVMRLDGDLYESTMDALVALYPKLQKKGYVIIDDYGWVNCRKAVEDYRNKENIKDLIIAIDSWGVYWRKN